MMAVRGMGKSVKIIKWLWLLFVAAMVAAMLGSCTPRKIITNTVHTHKEYYKDTTVYIQGDVVSQPLSDSFLNMLKMRFKNNLKDTVRIISRTGNAELQIYVDQFGQLQAACEAKDREINALIKIIEQSKENKTEHIVTPRFSEKLLWALLAIVVFLGFLVLIINKIR